MKNTMYAEEMFDAINLAFTKRVLILYNNDKIAICFEKVCFIGLKISDFGWKRGVFLAQNPRKGGIFQAWVRAWYTFWSRVGGRAENMYIMIQI